jgi:hypothetical protein
LAVGFFGVVVVVVVLVPELLELLGELPPPHPATARPNASATAAAPSSLRLATGCVGFIDCAPVFAG